MNTRRVDGRQEFLDSGHTVCPLTQNWWGQLVGTLVDTLVGARGRISGHVSGRASGHISGRICESIAGCSSWRDGG